MSTEANNLDPVVKTRVVALDPEGAFRLFTEQMDAWWPMTTHSVGGDPGASIEFGTAAGQAVTEITPAGVRHRWAKLLQLDAPRRVVLAWHPGGDASRATQLDVRFADSSDGTQLRLHHSGWERLGDQGPTQRREYHLGWDLVLEPFIESAIARATA